MRSFAVAAASAALCALLGVGSRPAAADVLVNVSKTSQRMSVLVDGTAQYNWKVSTGVKRYTTPSGVFKPQWLARKWKSRQYNNAPMPHSIFFHQGYAIHGTEEVSRLGRIASHGCVRLAPENAAKLYSIVQNQIANTRIVVSDDVIEMPGEAPKRKPSQFVAENTVAPAAKSDIALEAMALRPKKKPSVVVAENTVQPAAKPEIVRETPTPAPESVATEKPPVVQPADTRERAKPKPARKEKVARADSRPGFHW
jgi:L,D-transpeptidase-like protein